jgi:alpha-L-fucosidase
MISRRTFLSAAAAAVPALAASKPAPFGALPSERQLAWHKLETTAFLHFSLNTFTDKEWGYGDEDPNLFQPAKFDADAIVEALAAADMRGVILTAKHHDGFCLWPTKTTDHCVRRSPWRGGQGDVVREVADAARAAGIGLGLYLSPWDRNAPSYGSGQGYNDFYIAQLTELLSNYGPLTEVWFDGANGEGPNGKRQSYDWARIHSTVRRLQPNALMFSDSGPDIRWIGNERGTAGDPNWCTVDPSIVTHPGMDGPEIIRSLQNGDEAPRGSVWRPGEADVSIRPGWFHHPAEDVRVKSAATLMEIWHNSVGRNANLLLNVPPTQTGLIAEPDLKALADFGAAQDAFHANAVRGSFAHLPGADAYLTLQFERAERVNAIAIEEDLAKGQRVKAFHVNAADTVARGTTIGHRRVLRFEPVTTTGLQLLVEDALDIPAIRNITAYRA